jgi:hypothetical protein
MNIHAGVAVLAEKTALGVSFTAFRDRNFLFAKESIEKG